MAAEAQGSDWATPLTIPKPTRDFSGRPRLPNQPGWLGIPRSQRKEYGFDYEQPPRADEYWSDGQIYRVGELSFKVIHCPGHTPGHVVLFEPSERKVFVGDCLFAGSIGRTDLPGGNAEEGESLQTAIIRETAEETRLVVSGLTPFGFGCDPASETITFPNGDRCQFFVLMFCTRSFQGRAEARDAESDAVRWFAPDRLPDMLPNMARSVEAYRRFEATREFQLI